LGLIVGGWLQYYTDWFPIVAGVISLGGIFAWIPFVGQWVPKARLKWITEVLSRVAFGNPLVRVCTLVAISVFLIAFNFAGTIQVEAPPDSIEKTVRIEPVNSEVRGSGFPLRPGETIRSVQWTSWISNRKFRVKVSGYPDQSVVLHPWQRLRLAIPGSFLKPVVLLRPEPKLYGELAIAPLTLVVTVGDVSRIIKEYHGETVWIGCERDVDIPASVVEQWRAELAELKRPLFLRNWLRPIDLEPGLEIKPGDEVHVEIKLPDASPEIETAGVQAAYVTTKFRVSQLYRPQDFPQVEDLHAPQQ
jgi:hypothetical protein